MKKISIVASLLSMCFAGCLKDTPPTDFGTLKPIVELFYIEGGQTAHGGLENFAKDAILTAGQTAPIVVNFNANLASVDPFGQDLTVTLGVDDAKRISYNASNTTQYSALPANTFTFASKTAVIKAGSRLANFTISFDPTKIDPTQNYMLPISITDAQGQTVSGNFGTIYFHMIGNPLAGAYNWDFTRWNNTAGTGAPSSLSFTGHQATFLPVDPNTIQVASGYFTQPRYILTFSNNNGVLSNFAVTLNPDDVASMLASGVVVVTGPTIVKADPVNKIFTFQYTTLSRYIIDSYHNP